ncbi:putative amino acid/polyamine transporter I [Helianthus debilis subsp. tardiflorus]
MGSNKNPILTNDHNTTDKKSNPKLTLLPLIALIFYEVSGGPFGVEDSVRSGGGALLSLLGFSIFPLFWSILVALVTAELATSFPKNGGYVIWISSAFGPFWGFQEGFWKWFSGVMDNALYPVLFLDYLKHSIPVLDQLYARVPVLIGLTGSGDDGGGSSSDEYDESCRPSDLSSGGRSIKLCYWKFFFLLSQVNVVKGIKMNLFVE